MAAATRVPSAEGLPVRRAIVGVVRGVVRLEPLRYSLRVRFDTYHLGRKPRREVRALSLFW